MKHFLLFYNVVPDYLARRVPLRSAHLTLARDAVTRGCGMMPVTDTHG